MATNASAPMGSSAPSDDGSGAERHPAPHRHLVSLRALWFGLFGAPAGWSLQVIVGFAVTSHGCFPRSLPLTSPIFGGLRVIAVVVTVVATIVAIAAGLTALASWRRTKNEMRGTEHGLLEVGEGRTRFMALSGVLVSALFLLAIVMSFLSIAVVPPCTYGA